MIDSKNSASASNGQGPVTLPSNTPAVPAAGSDLAKNVHSFFTDIREAIPPTLTAIGCDLANHKATSSTHIAASPKSVKSVGAALTEHGRNTVKATQSYVSAQPWKAIGIGAGIGLVLGLVIRRA